MNRPLTKLLTVLLVAAAHFAVEAADPPVTLDQIREAARRKGFKPATVAPSSALNTQSALPSTAKESEPDQGLRLSTVSQTARGGGETSVTTVAAVRNKFALSAPRGWITRNDAGANTIILDDPQDPAHITLRFIESKDAAVPVLDGAKKKQEAARHHPGASFVEEFPLSALNQTGVGFDFEVLSEGVAQKRFRHGCIPFPGGWVEVVLACSPSDFEIKQHDFNQILLSLRQAPIYGTLDVKPRTTE